MRNMAYRMAKYPLECVVQSRDALEVSALETTECGLDLLWTRMVS